MQVFISHFGLDLARAPATWPSAIQIDGATYDLKSGSSGTQYELARPIILRDESGEIIGGRARSRREAEQLAAGLVRKNKAKEVTVQEAPSENLNEIKLNVDLSYNDDLFRFSTKLACNMAILMGREALIKESGVGGYLRDGLSWGTCLADCDTTAIRRLRPQLSHTVYIEFGPESHAVVIFFGSMQIYVPLPASERGAVLGFLDPITGEESFSAVTAVNVTPPPKIWYQIRTRSHLTEMLRWLEEEANARGATHPPDLTVGGYDFGTTDATNR
jgi:hypothetical protein